MQNYCYLGNKITQDNKNKLDTISRILQGRQVFQRYNHLLTTSSMRIKIKNFIYEYMDFEYDGLYRYETWIVSSIKKGNWKHSKCSFTEGCSRF